MGQIKHRFHIIDSEVTSVKTADGSTVSLWGLFVPLLIEQLLINMMGTVNTLVLGHYSDDSVAAVGAANQVIMLVYTCFSVISGGASIVISHRLGEGEKEQASDAAFASICFAGAFSAVVSVIMAVLTPWVMAALNLEGEVLSMAITYFRICISFALTQGIITAIGAVLRSYGKPKISVFVSVLMNSINALINYLVVFRPIEIPLYGVSGIATANVISRIVAMIAIVICFSRAGLHLDFAHKNFKSLRCIGNIMRIGLPGGVSSLSYSLSQVVTTSILAGVGAIALSTKVYISSIVFYVYVVGMSLGFATSVVIGWMTGAREYDKAYRLNQQVLRVAVGLNIVLSTILFFCYKPLLSLFTQNAEIIQMARGIFLVDIFVEIGRAFNHVEDNSLRGAGDVVFPMVVAVVSCWLMSVLFSYILGIRLGWGLAGCWIAFMMDELFRGLNFFFRFRSRKWETKKV